MFISHVNLKNSEIKSFCKKQEKTDNIEDSKVKKNGGKKIALAMAGLAAMGAAIAIGAKTGKFNNIISKVKGTGKKAAQEITPQVNNSVNTPENFAESAKNAFLKTIKKDPSNVEETLLKSLNKNPESIIKTPQDVIQKNVSKAEETVVETIKDTVKKFNPKNINDRLSSLGIASSDITKEVKYTLDSIKPETIEALPDSFIEAAAKAKTDSSISNIIKITKYFSPEELKKITEKPAGELMLAEWTKDHINNPSEILEALELFAL